MATAAAILAFVLIGASAIAQPVPDDDPPLPNYRTRMNHADSLMRLDRTQAAVEVLEELRGSAEVRNRVEDYSLLLMRLARAYAWLGDVERSLERATEAHVLGHRVWNELTASAEFAAAREHPAFQALIATARTHEFAWEQLSMPMAEMRRWSDTISLPARIFGVSAIWSAARYSFAYFDRTNIRWDSVYMATLADVQMGSSMIDYYRRLQQMAATLVDGHTAVLFPPELVDTIGYYPRFRTSLVEDRVVIVNVMEPRLGAENIEVGDEIKAIDGVPIRDFASNTISPFVSASSKRDREIRTYDYHLLAGPFNSTIVLDIVGSDGRHRRELVSRRWCWDDIARLPSIEIQLLGTHVAYCNINTFDDEYVVELFDLALKKHSDVRALIIDLRNNNGGQSRNAFELLARLMPVSFETHSWETPMHRGYFNGRGRRVEWYRQSPGYVEGWGDRAFAGTVVVLVGPNTLSAAEHFVAAFAHARRGKVIGDTTGGSTGHTIDVQLPGGGICHITTTRDYLPDGRPFNAIGIPPDIVVERSVSDIRARYDRALWTARSIIDMPVVRDSVIQLRMID